MNHILIYHAFPVESSVMFHTHNIHDMFNFILYSTHVPFIFWWNYDHDVLLCDTPLLNITLIIIIPISCCNSLRFKLFSRVLRTQQRVRLRVYFSAIYYCAFAFSLSYLHATTCLIACTFLIDYMAAHSLLFVWICYILTPWFHFKFI